MILRFKYGFFYQNILYGWKDKELYRLPYRNSANMNYPLKKLNQIMVGNKPGYQVGGKQKTIEQLKELTIVINQELSVIKDSDVPF